MQMPKIKPYIDFYACQSFFFFQRPPASEQNHGIYTKNNGVRAESHENQTKCIFTSKLIQNAILSVFNIAQKVTNVINMTLYFTSCLNLFSNPCLQNMSSKNAVEKHNQQCLHILVNYSCNVTLPCDMTSPGTLLTLLGQRSQCRLLPE